MFLHFFICFCLLLDGIWYVGEMPSVTSCVRNFLKADNTTLFDVCINCSHQQQRDGMMICLKTARHPQAANDSALQILNMQEYRWWALSYDTDCQPGMPSDNSSFRNKHSISRWTVKLEKSFKIDLHSNLLLLFICKKFSLLIFDVKYCLLDSYELIGPGAAA